MSDRPRFPPLAGKIALIVVASLALLAVLSRVESLISERNVLRGQALEHVATSAGHAQQVGVGLVTLPLTRTWDNGGRSVTETTEFHLLAQTVDFVGRVSTDTRHSGIYTVPTYLASLQIKGTLSTAPLRKALTSEAGVVKSAGPVTLFVALTDPAGVRRLDAIRVGGKTLPVAPMLVNGLKGVGVELGNLDELAESLDFSFDLSVSGTEQLQFRRDARGLGVVLAEPELQRRIRHGYRRDGDAAGICRGLARAAAQPRLSAAVARRRGRSAAD
jgi:inner membrane protein involved in colicin E2 resistance